MIEFTRFSATNSETFLRDQIIAETWTWGGEFHWWVVDRAGVKYKGGGEPSEDISAMMLQKVRELYPDLDIQMIFPDED